MAIQIKQIDLNLKRRFDPLSCTLDDFRSSDTPMRRCLKIAWVATKTDLPILILGESGTGKTLLSRAIHNTSNRGSGPFVSFNAAALSEGLLDSQLFGHEPGAFTGATRALKGKFELAHGGTLFIDEIADMSGTAQAKILRAVEYGEFERLGSESLQVADVRLISATHLNRDQFSSGGSFRPDLFYRLTGMTVEIPPLRCRRYDLPLLIAAEIEWAAREQGKKIVGLGKGAAQLLLTHAWPGNLRELNRVIQAAVAMCQEEILRRDCVLLPNLPPSEPSPLPAESSVPSGQAAEILAGEDNPLSLAEVEVRHIAAVYRAEGRNKSQTSRKLRISRSTLDRKLRRYKIGHCHVK